MEKLYHQFRGLQSVREGSWHIFWAPIRRKKKNAPSTTIINMTVIPIQKWTFPDRKSSHLSRSNSDLDGGGSSSDKGMMAVGVDVEFVPVVVSIASLRLLAVEGMSGAAMSRWETTFPAADDDDMVVSKK